MAFKAKTKDLTFEAKDKKNVHKDSLRPRTNITGHGNHLIFFGYEEKSGSESSLNHSSSSVDIFVLYLPQVLNF